jgi:hypothetical protein
MGALCCMSTFATMRARIREELNRGSSYDSVINRAIDSAIVYYRRFAFNSTRSTTNAVAGVEYYVLPTDFIEADHMRLEESSSDWDPMIEVTYDWIEDHRRNADYRSRPQKYAIQNQELRVWPVPDQSYTFRMTYHSALTEVSASASDAATNAWMTDAEELIRLHAEADILETYIGGPDQAAKAQVLRAREQMIYGELKRLANRQQSTGRITPWS